jgi:hypothetical protein
MSGRPTRLVDADLDAALCESDRLREQLSTLLTSHQQLSSLLVAADTRTGELMKVLVSVRTMIESRDAGAALDGVRDILVNVIGTDDFVIYAIDPRDQMLVPLAGVGELLQSSSRLPLYTGWVGEVVRSGALVITDDRTDAARHPEGADVAAVVPLKVLDRVVGAIVIARLLPHRELLGSCDREVLRMLGAYAATAIIAAGRRSGWRELPRELR